MQRQGIFVKNQLGKASYESFKPSDLKDVVLTLHIDDEINNLLNEINANFKILKELMPFLKCQDLFLYAYVLKEALESSKIEGTECTMQDVLSETYILKNKKIADIKEVISNIHAINFAIEKISELPISTRLYKEIHKVLLKNVRGENKNPGEIRTSQNWIGSKNIDTAKFIPPNMQDMNDALKSLDEYINNEDANNINTFINCALIHYQFETIHPFLDGNGRLGRILIILYLIKCEVISKPVVYLSYFLKSYQSEYYERLMRVRLYGEYENYIKFFLRCLNEAISSSVNKFKLLENLHSKNIEIINKEKDIKVKLFTSVFSYIERNPIFSIKSAMESTGLSFYKISTSIIYMKEKGILKDYLDIKRNRVFIYWDLYDIVND